MSLSENLQYLRTRQTITQEQLAEQLNVSRQSVSKWESGASFPEMDTLLKLCDLFHTDLDTLLRGSVAQTLTQDSTGYDHFMTQFALKISLSVSGILLGVALALFCQARGLPEILSCAVLLLIIAISVVVLVASGIQHSNFSERNPHIEDFYTQKQRDAFNQRFVWYIAAPIGAILFDVVLMLLAFSIFPEEEPYESYFTSLFLTILSIAVFFLVYGGIQKSKYDINAYNQENDTSPLAKLRNSLNGAIMLTATIIFLIWGLSVEDGFHISWITFPIGGILCGILTAILQALQQRNGTSDKNR